MKNSAAFFLLLLHNVLSFSSVTVNPSSANIYEQTTYLATLTLTQSLPNVPAGFKAVMILPSQFKVVDPINSLPSTCILKDFLIVSPDIALTSAYSSTNPQNGQCGVSASNTYTLITPQQMTAGLKFLIGNIQNPIASLNAANIGPIQFYGYNPGSTSPDYQIQYSFTSGTFNPGTLTSSSFSQTNTQVGAWNSYTFGFTLQHNVPQDGKIQFVFSSDFGLSTPANTPVTGQIGSGASESLTPTISSNTLFATGLFSSDLTVAAGVTSISITIGWLRNIRYIGTSSIVISTTTSNNEKIDSMTIYQGSSSPCPISYLLLYNTVTTVNLQNSLSIFFQTNIFDANLNNTFIIKYTFPSTFTINSVSCSIVSGLSDTSISCSQNSNVLSTTAVTQSTTNIGINFNYPINPPNTKTTDYFKISTYTSGGALICQNTTFSTFTATPNAINVVKKSRNSAYVGDSGPYILSFTTSTQMPSYSWVKIVLPIAELWEDSGIVCNTVINGVTSTSNICTKSSSPADSSTYELIMNEWCSSTDTSCSSCCSAGKTLTISIGGVKNPYYVNPNLGTTIKIYTLNPDKTGLIDDVTSGLQFTPALQARTVSDAILNRSDDTVGEYTVYNLSYTPTIDYMSNAMIVFTIPANSIFAADNGNSMQCTNIGNSYGNSNTPTCSNYTQNASGSITSITFENMCPSGCTKGVKIVLQVSNIQNPNTIAPFDSSWKIAAYTSAWYIIENGGISTANLNSINTSTISGITATRTNNNIKSSISMAISFNYSTFIASTGYIDITFPIDMVVIQTTFRVYRISDNVELNILKTVDSSTNSVVHLTITNYCSSTCKKGGSIGFAMAGIKNMDYVITITGGLSIYTSNNGYNSDVASINDVSTILAPFIAGSLTNIDIHPYNPTVSAVTNYRIIFTSQNNIPIGAMISVAFPSGVSISSSLSSCTSYINTNTTLQCTVSSNTVTLKNGFQSQLTGPVMIGFWISNITNGNSAKSYGVFAISTLDSTGFVIDTDSTMSISFFSSINDNSCSSECQHCAGSSISCYSCNVPSSSPMLEGYSCNSECQSDYFLYSDLTCLRCHFTCASCLGPQSTDCTSCASGYLQSDNSCVTSCPSGTQKVNGVCVNTGSCQSPCATCSTSSTFCLSCVSSYPVLYRERGNCVAEETLTDDNCPTGYYEDSNKICQKCDNNCLDCFSASTHCNSCPTIYGETYLNKLDYTCVSKCPDLISVVDSTNKLCLPCDASCQTCSGISSNSCLSCPTSGTKYFTSDSQCVSACSSPTHHYYNTTSSIYQCISSCPSNYYLDSPTNYCLPCMSSCLTCNDGVTCKTCDLSGSTPFITDTNLCVQKCTLTQYLYTLNGRKICYSNSCPAPSLIYYDLNNNNQPTCIDYSTCPSQHYYITSDNSSCLACDQTCLTCNGTASNNCLTCDLSGSTPFLTEDSKCVAYCSSSQFVYTLEGKKLCYNNACPSPSLKYYNISNNNQPTCISYASCPSQHYYITSDKLSCLACDITCLTCSGTTSNSCLTCDLTGSTPFLTEDSRCISNCNSTQFSYTLDGKKLCYDHSCPSPSLNYYDPNNNSQPTCISRSSCPSQHYYITKDGSSCLACDQTCLTCSSTASNGCLSCNLTGSSPFLTEDSKCVNYCNSTQFVYTLEGKKLCYENSCPSPSLKYYDPDNSNQPTCISNSSCPSQHYYITSDSSSCLACDQSCVTCNGSISSNCLSCNLTGSTPFLTADSKCVSVCPSNLFTYTFKGKKLCVSTCGPDYWNYDQSSSSKVCIDSCPDKYYQDTSNYYCKPCNISCKTCTRENYCSSCPDGTYYYQQQCYSKCPDGLIIEDGNCVKPCGSGCKTCDSNNPSTCITCKDSSPYLYKNVCYSNCPDGLYGNSATCKQCDKSCKTCYESSIYNCKSCYSNENSTYYLNPDNSCQTSCPENYTANSTTLLCDKNPTNPTDICDKSCKTCSGSSLYNCTSCYSDSKSTYYLNPDHSCQITCPSNYTANSTTLTCDKDQIIIPPVNKSTVTSSGISAFAVYALIGETLLALIIIVIAKFASPDMYLQKATILFMFSAIEFTERIFLLIFLWVDKGSEASILVGITASFIAGSSVLSMMFLILHLDPLVESSAALDEFSQKFKWSYRITRFLSLLFGIHFIRILYSGFFGLPVSTHAKTLGNVNAFRFPLERLSLYNLTVINVPQLFQHIAILGLYSYMSDVWQISLFGICLELFVSIFYFWDWFKGPWRI
ncbi:unnamed protein product [Blepharisma stoltei]|uniref:TNFR-Cys domain-containing protein n=1 Tax=Blepharisma stoltei TaxID=1481888 RepID=A0AAU9K982_9CILI|nr:unnamed protein product [Blepharisma stoltei]